MQRAMCAVCGGHEIERDQVLDQGVLELAQCTRCQHRWTERSLLAAASAAECGELEVVAAAA